jgi:hypothetical protein
MYQDSHVTLKIEIKESGGYELDSLAPHTVCFEADMLDCNAHGWFAAFEKIMRLQGFSEDAIARGACQLAFNEYRPKELMASVAKEYDLILLEDQVEMETSQDLATFTITSATTDV